MLAPDVDFHQRIPQSAGYRGIASAQWLFRALWLQGHFLYLPPASVCACFFLAQIFGKIRWLYFFSLKIRIIWIIASRTAFPRIKSRVIVILFQNASFFFFFFLMFLPLIGFTVWGFGKNHLEDGTSLQILFRSQGQWSPSTNKRRKGIYMASLIIEFKWFLFLYLLNFPKPGPPYYKSSW